MGIYLGPNSVYARKEGIYVKNLKGPGINTYEEAAGIAYLILRDYKRKWTYDRYGRKIRMVWYKENARGSNVASVEGRLEYMVKLAEEHGGPVLKIEDLVEYIMHYKRLPPGSMNIVKRVIVKVRSRGKKKGRKAGVKKKKVKR